MKPLRNECRLKCNSHKQTVMAESGISKSSLFASLPPLEGESLAPMIRNTVAAYGQKLVVLDDDPTGTQTVHDVPVLTRWDVETLTTEFQNDLPCFYLLTNSRSVGSVEAQAMNREIARNLQAAANAASRGFAVISRSDSTLRGHYPAETDVLAEVLGPYDATILIPYFEAGGRYTLNDTHYVAEGDRLVPAAETPFARDPVFGYRSSNLRDYVEEKTAGRVKAGEVHSFGIADLRSVSPCGEPSRKITTRLLSLPRGSVAIVNACHPRDLESFALGSLVAERAGARFLYRTAAQFVAARLGLEPCPLWRPPAVTTRDRGGLIVVGSHVPKTSEQLARLLENEAIERIELEVAKLISSERSALVQTAVASLNRLIASGRDVVVFTSRQLITGQNAAASLDIGAAVSHALVEVVRRLDVRPRYLIAKGGITSSDLATRGLGVKRAQVLGQIYPGVPVWELGSETKFPGLPYVIFPGNVGGPDALKEVVRKFELTFDHATASPHNPL